MGEDQIANQFDEATGYFKKAAEAHELAINIRAKASDLLKSSAQSNWNSYSMLPKDLPNGKRKDLKKPEKTMQNSEQSVAPTLSYMPSHMYEFSTQ